MRDTQRGRPDRAQSRGCPCVRFTDWERLSCCDRGTPDAAPYLKAEQGCKHNYLKVKGAGSRGV